MQETMKRLNKRVHNKAQEGTRPMSAAVIYNIGQKGEAAWRAKAKAPANNSQQKTNKDPTTKGDHRQQNKRTREASRILQA